MNSSDYLKLNLPELTDKYSLENENENWQAIDSFASTTNSALEDLSGAVIDTEVTEDSTNAVASGAVYTALQAKADTFTTDTTVTSGSTNPVTSGAVYTALQNKATIETGSLPSNNYAWYANDSTKTLTGTYEIIGDYIFITATAYRISGWGVVYYTLPMTPLGACASTAFESDTNYTIQTNTLTSEGVTYPVVQIRATDGSTMTDGTIMFTMMYKVS